MAKLQGAGGASSQSSENAPEPTVHTLPSGRVVKWRMPDPWEIMAFSGVLPDALTAATIKLLKAEGSLLPEDDPRSYHHDVEFIKGRYGIAAAGLVEPKLDIRRAWGDGSVIGRCDIAPADVEYCYYILFRTGAGRVFEGAGSADIASGVAAAPSAGDDVSQAAG